MILQSLINNTRHMPLDRCTITTSFPINPAVITNTDAFRIETGLELRDFRPSSQFIKGFMHQSAVLQIGNYGGIRVYAKKANLGNWEAKSIEVNPAKLLYGHNGRILSEAEGLTSLSVAAKLLSPLLANAEDAIHLIPGLADNSLAYWSKLEIPMHLHDPDGTLLHAFRNPGHPAIHKPALRGDGESVKLGAKRGGLKINIYRKDLEMAQLLRENDAPEPAQILRVEVSLSQDKLIRYLGSNVNTCRLDGISRLVRFSGSDLVAAHRLIVADLKGCFSQQQDSSDAPNDNKLGRFMALIAHNSSLTLDDLTAIYDRRFGLDRNTKSRVRTAAMDELSRQSPFSVDEVFSPAAYENQPCIQVPRLERFTRQRRNDNINPLVAANYASTRASVAALP